MTSLIPGGFGTPTNDDRRPWLWFMSIIGCSYSFLALAARLMAKWDVLGIEDAFMGLSYVFAIIYWGLFDRALWNGLGQSNHDGDLTEASKLFWSAWVVLLCAIYFSKISVLLFERRLFTGLHKRTSLALHGVMAFMATCGIIVLVLSSAACDFEGAFRSPPDTCSGLKARNITILVLEVATELVLVVTPTYLVSRSMMSIQKKVTVTVLFSFRLLCIPFMAAATTSLTAYAANHDNKAPARAITTAAIWTQVVLGWSISSASIPCVKSFLAAFEAETRNPMSSVVGSDPRGSRFNHVAIASSKNKTSQVRSYAGKASIDKAGQRQRTEDDIASVNSDGSERIMIEHGIQRRVEIDVTRESRPGTATAGNDSQKSMNSGNPYNW